MTDAELRDALEEWVKDYCRDQFEDGLPGGVEVFLDRAVTVIKEQTGVQSERLGDYAIAYLAGEKPWPGPMLALLHPYRRAGGLRS